MFQKENIKSTHTFKGVEYNIFETDGFVGWSAIIKGDKYGNFIENSGQWLKGETLVSPVDAVHDNAKLSINLINTK